MISHTKCYSERHPSLRHVLHASVYTRIFQREIYLQRQTISCLDVFKRNVYEVFEVYVLVWFCLDESLEKQTLPQTTTTADAQSFKSGRK